MSCVSALAQAMADWDQGALCACESLTYINMDDVSKHVPLLKKCLDAIVGVHGAYKAVAVSECTNAVEARYGSGVNAPASLDPGWEGQLSFYVKRVRACACLCAFASAVHEVRMRTPNAPTCLSYPRSIWQRRKASGSSTC